ncbi:hypothetical protein LX36DRAFT_661097 [Colletotrichum falcatum]|nr:hypothetical protein LX36DRAFT_661097 [Colletotrichum falcatum]
MSEPLRTTSAAVCIDASVFPVIFTVLHSARTTPGMPYNPRHRLAYSSTSSVFDKPSILRDNHLNVSTTFSMTCIIKRLPHPRVQLTVLNGSLTLPSQLRQVRVC